MHTRCARCAGALTNLSESSESCQLVQEYRRSFTAPELAPFRHAPRLNSPGHQFPWKKAGISAQALREDRILAEVRATGGDPRGLAYLFGLSIEGTHRYVGTFEHPDLAGPTG